MSEDLLPQLKDKDSAQSGGRQLGEVPGANQDSIGPAGNLPESPLPDDETTRVVCGNCSQRLVWVEELRAENGRLREAIDRFLGEWDCARDQIPDVCYLFQAAGDLRHV